jgi:hypothetical protein
MPLYIVPGSEANILRRTPPIPGASQLQQRFIHMLHAVFPKKSIDDFAERVLGTAHGSVIQLTDAQVQSILAHYSSDDGYEFANVA